MHKFFLILQNTSQSTFKLFYDRPSTTTAYLYFDNTVSLKDIETLLILNEANERTVELQAIQVAQKLEFRPEARSAPNR